MFPRYSSVLWRRWEGTLTAGEDFTNNINSNTNSSTNTLSLQQQRQQQQQRRQGRQAGGFTASLHHSFVFATVHHAGHEVSAVHVYLSASFSPSPSLFVSVIMCVHVSVYVGACISTRGFSGVVVVFPQWLSLQPHPSSSFSTFFSFSSLQRLIFFFLLL